MKNILLSTAIFSLVAGGVSAADDIKIGILFGFTGPIESLVAQMGPAADFAINEVSNSGAFLNGQTVTSIRADSTCIDAAVASSAAERLITSDKVAGIVGADCSGVTTAALTNVALPNGMVMVSPSATSPALSTIADNGLFFRTAPSDARQGQVMAQIILDRGYKQVAMTYTNNDYGKGLSDAFQNAYQAAGGVVTINISYEDGKGDYAAEVGALAAAGGDVLVVVGYIDQGGRNIIETALDTGAFDKFVLPDGMVGESLPKAIGDDLDGSFGQVAGTDSPGIEKLTALAQDSFDTSSPYTGETYDAAALILLAMQAANSTNPNDYKDKIFDVANAPGVKILPRELAKGLKILAQGGDIDYVGASNVELIGSGENAGSFREIEIKNQTVTTVHYR